MVLFPRLNTIPTAHDQSKNLQWRTLFSFMAGMFAALPLAIAGAVPIIQAEIQAAVADAKTPLTVKTASATLACGQPAVETGSAGGLGGGHVLGESISAAPTAQPGGQGGSQNLPPAIQHIVEAHNAITGPTGPGSTNVVTSNQTETTTVTNTNNFNVSNDNTQSATSGSAAVDWNTTGGNANTGNAWNDNSTAMSFVVTN